MSTIKDDGAGDYNHIYNDPLLNTEQSCDHVESVFEIEDDAVNITAHSSDTDNNAQSGIHTCTVDIHHVDLNSIDNASSIPEKEVTDPEVVVNNETTQHNDSGDFAFIEEKENGEVVSSSSVNGEVTAGDSESDDNAAEIIDIEQTVDQSECNTDADTSLVDKISLSEDKNTYVESAVDSDSLLYDDNYDNDNSTVDDDRLLFTDYDNFNDSPVDDEKLLKEVDKHDLVSEKTTVFEKENVIADSVNYANQRNSQQPQENDSQQIDILGNGLVIKKIVSKGDGRRPIHSELVTIQYIARLQDGTSVELDDALSFVLGDGDVTCALELCLPLMELNEVCTLTTDAKYAYGSHGNGSNIPPNEKITYTITLTNIEPTPSYSTFALEQIIFISEKKRNRGNYHFERNDYSSAISSYTRALRITDSYTPTQDDPPKQLQSLLDIRIKCYNNLAASQLKVEAFNAAVKSCDQVLKYSPDNVKALFRKAKACSSLGGYKDACGLLKRALQLEPESKLIHVELARVTNKIKNDTKSEQKMYQKMFGLQKPSEKAKSNQPWKTWGMTIAGAVLVAALSVSFAVYRYNNQH